MKLSLSRLELMIALLTARMASEMKIVMDGKSTIYEFFYTDSQFTGYTIQNASKIGKQFVTKRVKEIQFLNNLVP